MSVNNFFLGSSFTPTHKLHFIRWLPPTPGTVKLNFDGSLQGKSIAGGYILRDWREVIIVMGASNYGNTSVVMVESRMLKDGLQAALKFEFSSLEIEDDNSVVIDAVKKEIEAPWIIKNVRQDIWTLIQQAQHVQVIHIYREANMVADWLSKFGYSIADTWLSTECDSLILREIVQDDRIERTLVRRGACPFS